MADTGGYLRSDAEIAVDAVNANIVDKLPGHMGIVFSVLTRAGATGYIEVAGCHMAPNGFLHAGTIVTLADTLCGIACMSSLPDTAAGFTTIELKSNFFATATEGRITGTARPEHLGGTTQVWDCEVIHEPSDKRLALFRCTQMVLKRR
ncbi:MAG: PaaI family thioesterase [Pseudomonadota bacterium]